MKIFEVRETTLPDGAADVFMDYAKLALVMLEAVPITGLSFGEMACRFDLRKKLKEAKAGGTVEMSDEDVAALTACAQTMRWRVFSEDLVVFGDYIDFLATGKEPARPYVAPVREEKKLAEVAPGVEVHMAPEPEATV